MIGEQLGSLTPFREPHLWRGRPQKPVGPAAEGSEGAAVANAAQVGMAMRAVEERWGERSEPRVVPRCAVSRGQTARLSGRVRSGVLGWWSGSTALRSRGCGSSSGNATRSRSDSPALCLASGSTHSSQPGRGSTPRSAGPGPGSGGGRWSWISWAGGGRRSDMRGWRLLGGGWGVRRTSSSTELTRCEHTHTPAARPAEFAGGQ